MPDPDACVLRSGAEPTGAVRGCATWDPADVLLVVEVSDATLRADLTSKAAIYAEGGVEHCWVLARDALHVHREPSATGYAQVDVLSPGDTVTLPYADRALDVRELGAAYLGGTRLGLLGAAGLVRELRPGTLIPLSAAMTWNPAPWCPQVF